MKEVSDVIEINAKTIKAAVVGGYTSRGNLWNNKMIN
jgi:hypothetical protein